MVGLTMIFSVPVVWVVAHQGLTEDLASTGQVDLPADEPK
jgi:hypothetical protein